MTRKLSTPFAINSTLKNTIPISATSAQTAKGLADYTNGWTAINKLPIENGGQPPYMEDMNGLLGDITGNIVDLNMGLPQYFDSDYSTLIGGYPIGSRLCLNDNSGYVVSTIANNTNNPNNNLVGWSAEKLVDLSSIGLSNNADISDLLIRFINLSSNYPIHVKIPSGQTFSVSKSIKNTTTSKGFTLDLNNSMLQAKSVSDVADIGGYLIDITADHNAVVSIKNGTLDGSLREQNLFESTNVADLAKGVSGITVTSAYVYFENLTVQHMYGQATKCFCRDFITRNTHIIDCGGHWYTNDGYDMFGDAFYIGGAWNETGVVTALLENVTAIGKYSRQYAENHQSGSPLTQTQYSRIGVTIEGFGGNNNNKVYVSLINSYFQNYERGFHQELAPVTGFVDLQNTTFNCCVLFGSYVSNKLTGTATNCNLGFYDSQYNGSKGLVRSYSGSASGVFVNCNISNIGTTANYDILGSNGSVFAENCTFNNVAGGLYENSNIVLRRCKFNILSFPTTSYWWYGGSMDMEDVSFTYTSTSDSSTKFFYDQINIVNCKRVLFDRALLEMDAISLGRNFKDNILISDESTATSYSNLPYLKQNRWKVVDSSGKVIIYPEFLWGVSEDVLFRNRYYSNVISSNSLPISLITNDLVNFSKRTSLFLVVAKGQDNSSAHYVSIIDVSTYGRGYYVAVCQYDPSTSPFIKIVKPFVSVGSAQGSGLGVTIDSSLNLTAVEGYVKYINYVCVPYSELATLPYVPASLLS